MCLPVCIPRYSASLTCVCLCDCPSSKKSGIVQLTSVCASHMCTCVHLCACVRMFVLDMYGCNCMQCTLVKMLLTSNPARLTSVLDLVWAPCFNMFAYTVLL